jgi:hypothetical protein
MNIDKLIQSNHNQLLSYHEYDELFSNYATNGKTTGPNSTESLIGFTKLNFHRSKRIYKTIVISSDLAELIQAINTPQHWILLTETWCGDAANSVPVIGRIAALNPLIQLRILFRDENLELMDQFLTNNGRSIPKLIVTDEAFNVLFHWGPRPATAQVLYNDWKNSDPKPEYHDFHIALQQWYQQDAGQSIQQELMALILPVAFPLVKN